MKLSMSEILKNTQAISNRKQKIEYLKQNYSKQLHEMLAFGYDPRVKWQLPDAEPPYTPSVLNDDQGMMYNQTRKLYLFVEGGSGTNVPKARREALFIQLLESIDPEDAKLLLMVKSKKLPKGITQKLIEDAYGVYE